MGFRFRKTFKVAPGVKLNLNKKSVGLTIGGRGAKYTVNSSGRKTKTIGIPGTGLSYSQVSSNKKKPNQKRSSAKNVSYDPKFTTYINGVEQVNEPSKNDNFQLEYTRAFFSKKPPQIYNGKYSSLKQKLGWLLFIFLIMSFSNKIFLIPLGICFYLKYFWKRQDDLFRRKYLSAYSAFYMKNYKQSLENINFLINNGKYDDKLFKAKTECILNMNGIPYDKLTEELNNIKSEISKMESLANIDTVLEKYDLIAGRLDSLSRLERYGAFSSNTEYNPVKSVSTMLKNKWFYVNKAINKSYHDMLLKASELKTENGRKNRIIKFFENLEAYIDKFDTETIDFINELKQKELPHA